MKRRISNAFALLSERFMPEGQVLRLFGSIFAQRSQRYRTTPLEKVKTVAHVRKTAVSQRDHTDIGRFERFLLFDFLIFHIVLFGGHLDWC